MRNVSGNNELTVSPLSDTLRNSGIR